MALAKQNKNFFNFTSGIFTEGNVLNRPENTSTDEQNFEILRKGYRRRRHGLYPQTGGATQSVDFSTTYYNDSSRFNVFRWDNVGGDPDKIFHVLKTQGLLHFFEEVDGVLTATGNYIDLISYSDATTVETGFSTLGSASSTSLVANYKVSMSSGNGMLFVTGKYLEPFSVEYDAANDAFIQRGIDPLERDLAGADDGLGVATNPTSDIPDHRYNLYNQGWNDQQIDGAAGGGYLGGWFTVIGNYPSNAQIWTYGKYTDVSSGIEQFSAVELSWQQFGSMPAPKGRFFKRVMDTIGEDVNRWTTDKTFTITQVVSDTTNNRLTFTTGETHDLVGGDVITFTNGNFYRSGSNKDDNRFMKNWYVVASSPAPTGTTFAVNSLDFNISNTFYPVDTCNVVSPDFSTSISVGTFHRPVDTYERPHHCVFHAQRLWMAGHTDTEFGRRLWFSQIMTKQVDAGKQYQDADPTSEHISDLLPTDGGYIAIPDMGLVVNMYSYGHYLIVLADNGVWAVGPGDKGYFQADDYSVVRLSYTDVIFPEAAVGTDDAFFYFTTAGLFMITAEQITKSPEPQNISLNTIQTLYLQIVQNSTAMTATYDETNKRIIWLYSYVPDDPGGAVTFYQGQYTRALVLDLTVGAFFRYTFYPPNSTYDDFQVLAIATTKKYNDDQSKIKLFCRTPQETSYRLVYVYEFNEDSTFVDFKDFVGSGVGWAPPTYMTTTYEAGDDAARRKFATYLTAHFNRTETEAVVSGSDLVLSVPSSCQLTVKWNWTDRTIGEKASDAPREIYRLKRYYQPDVAGPWDNGLPITTTKNKLRGSGKSLQLHFSVPDYYDCQLLGWQLSWSGITDV